MIMREWCLRALVSIFEEHAYSNLYIQKHLHELSEQDRSLAVSIVYGTLQHQRYVRYQWAHMVQRSPKKQIALLLDMSIYQLLFLDALPDYAIIHEAVTIAARRDARAKGMVNGVLRRFQREGRRALPADEWQALAIETGLPDWLISMWKHQYGEACCRSLCHSLNDPHPQCVRVNRMRTTREALAESGAYTCGTLSADALYVKSGNAADTEAYHNGAISIQSEASQMVALWMEPKPGEHLLDVCSAPGSKACHMAEIMHDEGVILCGDIHPHRVELIRQGAKRLQLHCIEAKVMDATQLEGVADAAFDRVLCDVPCSGYGVMGRKSDIRLRLSAEAMDTLIPLQQEILQCAARKVRIGGRLVYSTCTLNRKENEKQAERFLQTHPSFCLEREQTFFPHVHGTDGFYIARFLRKT